MMSDYRTYPMTTTPAPRERLGPAIGECVGSWTIVRRLGGGGFGEVYQARHRTTGRPAALKVLRAHLVASPELRARFDREVQVLARLSHPHIVQIVDAGCDDEHRPYLCMELLVGSDLGSLIPAHGLAIAQASAIFEPLCDAVAHAHELGIVHRDLKASNAFVCDGDGRVVLIDFGIAKISDALASLTASHQMLGTPGCMAPEQIRGGRADERSDVYALGGLLYHMVTGRPAFCDPSETMTQYLHLHARRPRPSALAPVPARLDEVIVRAMAIEPADRFADARALLAAVRAAGRESRFHAATTADCGAIFATVVDTTSGSQLDEPLLADLEAVLPAVERLLSGRGFSLALDLGSSAVFVSPLHSLDALIDAALAAWSTERPRRDPRVRIGLCVHRGPATIAGATVEPSSLLRPDTWQMPDPLEGVWVTAAIEPTARRLC